MWHYDDSVISSHQSTVSAQVSEDNHFSPGFDYQSTFWIHALLFHFPIQGIYTLNLYNTSSREKSIRPPIK